MNFLLSEGKFLIPTTFEITQAVDFWRSDMTDFLDDTEHYMMRFLSSDGNEHRFYELPQGLLDEQSFSEVTLRQLLFVVPDIALDHAAKSWQYAEFLRTHKHCGCCGSTTRIVDDEMATECTNCGHRCYPRVSPCIIVSIRKGDKILLAQGVRQRSAGFYSTLAGFVESAETLEQAVHREVFEEVGIKIKNLRYFGSQPWPFPHSIMCGFIADYQSGTLHPDKTEILHADWFTIDNMPDTAPSVSIASKLIDATIAEIQSTKAD